ncbi:MAG: AraC-like DNA-binding protein [Flavobacterium sp.]|jgi:AraC-like DNA-binding protein
MSEVEKNKVQGPSFASEGLYKKFRSLLEPSLQEAGISSEVFASPDVQIPLARHCKLLELAAQKTDNRNLGLHIGSKVHAREMGVLGYAIINSPTVAVALNNFVRYLHVYARGCDMDLNVSGSKCTFSYTYSLTDPTVVERVQEAECTMAMVKHVIETLSNSTWVLDEVNFEHPKPEETSELKRFFKAPMFFNTESNNFIFDSKYLATPIIKAEPRLYDLLEEHLSQAIESIAENDDLVSIVSNRIVSSLSSGVPNIEEVASSLFMTKRTLQRRLSAEGYLYNEMADEIRKKLAFQYVENSVLPLTEIAFLLGYAHVSAFSRAFRRWAGKTPIAYRGVNVKAS